MDNIYRATIDLLEICYSLRTITITLRVPDYITPDQYAFRPTGSITAAFISLFHKIISLLASELYVIIIALYFSKAFDRVRHKTLSDKMAHLNLPNQV